MSEETPINWQALNLVDDEASSQGTRAPRFMIKRIQEAQQDPNLRPTLQSLFRAHEMTLSQNEPREQVNQALSHQGSPRTEHTPERGEDRSADSPQRCSSCSPRQPRRPLHRNLHSDEEGYSKRRRSSSPSQSRSPPRRRGHE